MKPTLLLVPLLSLVTGACGTDARPQVDTARILAADSEPGNWLTHGRTYDEQRFSPLTSVDRSSVSDLGLAWEYELRTPRGASGTPIVVDGVMYVTSAWSLVYAIDARTGEELWVWDSDVDRSVGTKACCDVVNRGVAVYGGRVYVGVSDGRLVALDARDGSVVWETMTVDPDGPDGASSDGIMAEAAATWNGEWWAYGGGGTVWDAIVYDDEFDQLLIGLGNGSPWNQQLRSPGGGDNLFLASIVALDAATGEYRWHYQTTPGESWDFTATQSIILADLTIDGEEQPVAMQMPKNGFFYVINRETGELISGTAVVPMFSTAQTPPGFPLSWAYAIDEAGRPIENPEARYEGGTAVVRPSGWGAHNWHPMSYSPETGLVYIPVQELASDYTRDPAFGEAGGQWNSGVSFLPFPEDEPTRAAVRGGVAGYLAAWDPVEGREVWRIGRAGAWNGGTLATAGDLVFQGTVDGLFQAVDAATGEVVWEHDNQAATLAGPVSYEVDGEQYVSVLGGFGSAFYLIAGALLPEPGALVHGRVCTFKLGGTATVTPIFDKMTPEAAELVRAYVARQASILYEATESPEGG